MSESGRGATRAKLSQPAARVPDPPSGPPLAALPRRLLALLYEALLVAAMAFVAGFLLLPLVSPADPGRAGLTIPPVFARTMFACVLAGGAAFYFTWSWSEGRRTLAQKTWRIRLAVAGGLPPPRRTALLRYIAAWIGPAAAVAAYALLQATALRRYALVLVALNYAWALVDRDRQFLHDRVAGTRVLRAG